MAGGGVPVGRSRVFTAAVLALAGVAFIVPAAIDGLAAGLSAGFGGVLGAVIPATIVFVVGVLADRWLGG